MSLVQHTDFPSLFTVKHPLVQHKLTILRDIATTKKAFKELTYEITLLMGYEVTKDLPLTTKIVTTPISEFEAPTISGKKPVIVPILRAGIGMVDGFVELMPAARVGHIGMYRDEETLEPHSYFFKLPPQSQERQIFILDPMLATGGSAVAAITKLKQEGIKHIIFVCIVAAPEGIQALVNAHPDVKIYTASLDEKLNESGYIVPGLGDAGDRLFGTK